MRGAKCVPQREHGVVGEVDRPVDLEIASAILPIHVHEDTRCGHRVIKSGVEVCELGVSSAGDCDLAEFAIPRGGCIGTELVEVPMGNLCLKVAQRTVSAHRGDTNLNEDWPSVTRVETEQSFQIIYFVFSKSLRELDCKINDLISGPRFRTSPTDDGLPIDLQT